jgi:hypothetical protein
VNNIYARILDRELKKGSAELVILAPTTLQAMLRRTDAFLAASFSAAIASSITS